jgi:hypothetical protein
MEKEKKTKEKGGSKGKEGAKEGKDMNYEKSYQVVLIADDFDEELAKYKPKTCLVRV